MKLLVRWSLVAALAMLTAGMIGHLTAAYRFARAVLSPPGDKLYDLRVLAVGFDQGRPASVTLPLNDDTVLPGNYSLVSNKAREVVVLGEVLTVQSSTVVRRVLSHSGDAPAVGAAVRFNGWMGLSPGDSAFDFDWQGLLVQGPLGRTPAWYIPPKRANAKGRWAVHIHGRSATRAETLRGIAITRDLGFHNLACSYRNDTESVPGENSRYALGAEEWRDVDAVLDHAVQRGAREIVLYGWSMGGAIALQTLRHSRFRHLIHAVILDSPVLEWRSVLEFHGRLSRLPDSTIRLGMSLIERGSVRTGSGAGIPFDALSAANVLVADHPPILIMHSDDDGYVPIEPAIELAKQNSGVTLKHFTTARHCKLWNFDQTEYVKTVSDWIQPVLRASS